MPSLPLSSYPALSLCLELCRGPGRNVLPVLQRLRNPRDGHVRCDRPDCGHWLYFCEDPISLSHSWTTDGTLEFDSFSYNEHSGLGLSSRTRVVSFMATGQKVKIISYPFSYPVRLRESTGSGDSSQTRVDRGLRARGSGGWDLM